ncbi:MAG: DUF2400 domain-containing protein [Bacteroidales bacterium]|nr:DUF2400 domain-containing protein [Bacteroidales bacterium]
MNEALRNRLEEWEATYNDPRWFGEDPVAFPRRILSGGGSLRDVEIAAVFAAHLAWGRRAMIVRDLERLFDEMCWRPAAYVEAGCYRDDPTSLHRTVKWSETACICRRLNAFYSTEESLESLSVQDIRTRVFGQKEDASAANKKINMMRRWMVRRDGKVDMGLWRDTSPGGLIVPLDIHVYDQAVALGLTSRKSKDLRTALEITERFREIWPDDPVRGDFALFGYGVTHNR